MPRGAQEPATAPRSPQAWPLSRCRRRPASSASAKAGCATLGLIEMLDLVGVREHDPNTGDDVHAALVRAVADGDADTAGTVLREELEETLALLRRPVTRTPYVPE